MLGKDFTSGGITMNRDLGKCGVNDPFDMLS